MRKQRLIGKYLKKVLWPILAILTPVFLFILRVMPLKLLLIIADGIAKVWFKASSASYKLGMGNLDLIYGDHKSRREKEQLHYQSIRSILRSSMVFFYYSYRQDKFFERLLIDDDSQRVLDQIKTSGAVILTAHLGNWELLFAAISRFCKTGAIARSQKQFDSFVVNSRARVNVHTYLDSCVTSRQLTEKLSNGEFVCTILDRNVSHAKGIVRNFMGYPAFTPYHLVNLAHFGKVPVVGAFLVPEGDKFRLHLEEPIWVEDQGSKEQTYCRYVDEFLAVVEKYVRLYPQEWFWAHKRWSRPKGEVQFES